MRQAKLAVDEFGDKQNCIHVNILGVNKSIFRISIAAADVPS